MPASLRDVARELQMLGDDMTAYVNLTTGEVLTLTELDDVDPDAPGLPEWQRAAATSARDTRASGDWVELPTQVDLDEYTMMSRFCGTIPGEAGERLEDAIRGSGAFRRFRITVERLGLVDDWYAFRDRTYTSHAEDWLTARGIPFERDA